MQFNPKILFQIPLRLFRWFANALPGPNQLRPIFHWQFAGVLIPFFWGMGVGMIGIGLAVSAYGKFFSLTRFFFLAALIWTIGYWLSSDFLRAKNPRNWNRIERKKYEAGKKTSTYQYWRWIVVGVILSIFIASLVTAHVIEQDKELSQMGGTLFPANAPDPPDYCPAPIKAPPNSIRVYFGNSVAWSENPKMAIIKFGDKEILGLEWGNSGEVFINADIASTDGKSIIRISRNQFFINDNNIIRALFVHPDHSTLILTDQYENKLGIRYLNKHSIKIFGTFVIGSPYDKGRSVTIRIPEESGPMDVGGGNFISKSCWPIGRGGTAISVGD